MPELQEIDRLIAGIPAAAPETAAGPSVQEIDRLIQGIGAKKVPVAPPPDMTGVGVAGVGVEGLQLGTVSPEKVVTPPAIPVVPSQAEVMATPPGAQMAPAPAEPIQIPPVAAAAPAPKPVLPAAPTPYEGPLPKLPEVLMGPNVPGQAVSQALQAGVQSVAEGAKNITEGLTGFLTTTRQTPEETFPGHKIRAAQQIMFGLFNLGLAPFLAAGTGARELLREVHPKAESYQLIDPLTSAAIREGLLGGAPPERTAESIAALQKPMTVGEVLELVLTLGIPALVHGRLPKATETPKPTMELAPKPVEAPAAAAPQSLSDVSATLQRAQEATQRLEAVVKRAEELSAKAITPPPLEVPPEAKPAVPEVPKVEIPKLPEALRPVETAQLPAGRIAETALPPEALPPKGTEAAKPVAPPEDELGALRRELNPEIPPTEAKQEATRQAETPAEAELLPTHLYVLHKGRRYPVQSLEDASNKFRAIVEAGNIGSSETPSPLLVDEAGGIIGYISYNGKVWPGRPQEWKSGLKPLYDPSEARPAFRAAPATPFFSQLQQEVEKRLPARATPEQIRNIVTSGAIKADEVKWSGLEDYLAQLPAGQMVDKTALQTFLRENEVRVEEVQKQERQLTPQEALTEAKANRNVYYRTTNREDGPLSPSEVEHYTAVMSSDGRFEMRRSVVQEGQPMFMAGYRVGEPEPQWLGRWWAALKPSWDAGVKIPGSPFRLLDSHGERAGRELDALAQSSAYLRDLGRWIENSSVKIDPIARRFGWAKAEFAGFDTGFADTGVNIPARLLGTADNQIILNPWSLLRDAKELHADDPRLSIQQYFADEVVTTVLHEWAHQGERLHGLRHDLQIERLRTALGSETEHMAVRIQSWLQTEGIYGKFETDEGTIFAAVREHPATPGTHPPYVPPGVVFEGGTVPHARQGVGEVAPSARTISGIPAERPLGGGTPTPQSPSESTQAALEPRRGAIGEVARSDREVSNAGLPGIPREDVARERPYARPAVQPSAGGFPSPGTPERRPTVSLEQGRGEPEGNLGRSPQDLGQGPGRVVGGVQLPPSEMGGGGPARREAGQSPEPPRPELTDRVADAGKKFPAEDFARWADSMRGALGPGVEPYLRPAWDKIKGVEATVRGEVPPPAEPPKSPFTAPPRPPEATTPPPEGPPPLHEPILTLGHHKEVVDAAGEMFQRAGIARDQERWPVLSDQILDAMREGTLELPVMREILQAHGLSLAEFGESMFRPAVKNAAQRLQMLSVLQRRLNRMAIEAGKGTEADALLNLAQQVETLRREGGDEPPLKEMSWWRRADNIRRGLLVTQLATAIRNLETQLTRLPIDALDQATQRVFGGKATDPWAAWESFTDSLSQLRPTKGGLEARKASQAQIESLLQAFPKEWDRLFGSYSSDVARQAREAGTPLTGADKAFTQAEKVVNLLNFFNRFQEFVVRRSVFWTDFASRMERRGIDAESLAKGDRKLTPDEWDVIAPDVKGSVQKALEMTFAQNPPYGSVGWHFTRLINQLPIILTGPIPFPRFMVNSLKFLYEFSPLPLLNGKVFTAAERAKFAAGDRQTLSRASLGTAALLGAWLVRETQPDENKWYEVDVPGIGTTDIRPFNPFASYFFLGELAKRRRSNTLYKIYSQDIIRGIASANVRGGLGLFALDKLVRGLGELSKTGKLVEALSQAGGELLSGLLVPLRTLTDLYAQFDPELQIVRERPGEPLLGPAKAQFGIGEPQYLPTRAEPQKREQPALRQATGITAVSDKNDLEKELDRFQFARVEIQGPSTGDPVADNVIAKHMGQLAESQTVPKINSLRYQGLSDPQRMEWLRVELTRIRAIAKGRAKREEPDLFKEVQAERVPARKQLLNQEREGQGLAPLRR